MKALLTVLRTALTVFATLLLAGGFGLISTDLGAGIFGIAAGFIMLALSWRKTVKKKLTQRNEHKPTVQAAIPVPPDPSPAPEPVEEPMPKEDAPIEQIAEAPATPYEVTWQKRCDEFQQLFDSVRRVDVVPTSEMVPLIKSDEISFSNITKRSNLDSLGNFVVVDVETTGLKATCSVIEIAAIRFRNWAPSESFTTLLKPSKPIPKEATDISGITDAMVADKPHFRQVAQQLQSFIGNDAVVGHNLEFDLKFICRYVDLSSTKRKYYDTLELAQRTLKKIREKWDKELECYMDDYSTGDVENYKLKTLCQHYAIPRLTLHRAESDAFLTGFLFKKLAEARVDK